VRRNYSFSSLQTKDDIFTSFTDKGLTIPKITPLNYSAGKSSILSGSYTRKGQTQSYLNASKYLKKVSPSQKKVELSPKELEKKKSAITKGLEVYFGEQQQLKKKK